MGQIGRGLGRATQVLFGGGRTESGPEFVQVPRAQAIQPRVVLPGGGGFEVTGGGVSPTIEFTQSAGTRALGEEFLGLTRGQLGQVQQDIESMRALENPFLRAVRAPFEQQRAGLQRGLQRRGVFGSLAGAAAAPLASAEADAIARGKTELAGLIQGQQQFARQLAGDISGQQQLQIQTELQQMGLSRDIINAIVGSQFELGQVGQRSEGEQFTGIFEKINPAMFAGMCWVAREVLGTEDIRWVVFRDWLLNRAPKWLVSLYRQYGEQFANWLKPRPRAKRFLKPIFERVVYSHTRRLSNG